MYYKPYVTSGQSVLSVKSLIIIIVELVYQTLICRILDEDKFSIVDISF